MRCDHPGFSFAEQLISLRASSHSDLRSRPPFDDCTRILKTTDAAQLPADPDKIAGCRDLWPHRACREPHRIQSVGSNASDRGLVSPSPEPFDPMKKAFHALAKADLRADDTLPGAGRHLARSYALSPGLLAMSRLGHPF